MSALLSLALLVTPASASADLPQPDAAAIEQRALKARRDITNYHLVFRVTDVRTATPGPPAEARPPSRYEVWMDGDRLRIDQTRQDGEQPSGLDNRGRREITCRNCPQPGQSCHYVYLLTSITIVPRDKPYDSGGRPMTADMFDARAMGYTPYTILNWVRLGLGTVVGNPIRKDVRAEQSDLGGEFAWLIRSVQPRSNSDMRTWIVPGKGFNVARLEASGRDPKTGKSWTYVLDSDLARDAVSGVWFPRRCRLEVTQVDGASRQTEVETIEVSESEINRGVDPRVFTLAGMNIPPGAPVNNWLGPQPKSEYWTGEAIVTKPPTKPPVVAPGSDGAGDLAPRPAEPLPGSGRWWYAAAAMVLAGAAAVFLRRAAARGQ